MGVVFKARQPNSEQIVAVKIIRDNVFADPDLNKRFLQEIRALGRLQSVKNIVPIYHVGQFMGCFYFVMPLMAGGSLSARRKQFPLPAAKAVALVAKLARAVHQLHAHQVLHRDIKPSNILLDADDEPHLSDLGLAKLLDQDQSLTGSQERLGTPVYMAPEQTGLIPTEMSAQTDIWALGVVLYEMLVGKRPFATPDGEVSTTLLWKIVNETPTTPRTLQPDIDPGLEAVILKCLEKQPGDRFGSALDLAEELERWLRQETLQTPPATLTNSVRRFIDKRPWLSLTMAIGFVFVLAAAVAGFEFRRRNSPEFIHAEMLEELIANERIELVPEQGRPRWHRIGIEGNVNTAGSQSGHWVIESFDAGLVELLRDLPFDSYRLRAQLAHLTDVKLGPSIGQIGIFVAHRGKSSNPRDRHIWCNLTYNDLVNQERKPAPKPGDLPGNAAQLRYRVFCDTGVGTPIDDPIGWPKAVRFKPAGVNPVWRTLEIDFFPDRVVGRFDGIATAAMDHAIGIGNVHQNLLAAQQSHPARYRPLGDVGELNTDPRGGLGIVVTRAAVMVKNVTVTRLDNPK